MEEEATGKGLALSCKTQTLVCEGGKMGTLVSDEKQVKADVASVSGEESSEKNINFDDVEMIDAITEPETEVNKMEFEGDVEVKPVVERDGSEICEDVQRVSKTVKLAEVEMSDETAKSRVKSRNGESAGEEETVISSGGNQVTGVKAKCKVEDNGVACDGETLSVIGNDHQNLMKRGANRKPIPTDLIIEIFLRLPAKSVGRFRCLSKQWCSVLSGPDFIKLFLSRSCAHPRILFGAERKGVWSFFSSPQSSSSLVVAADFHTRFSEDVGRFRCSYAFGLIYFRDLWSSKVGTFYVVCNPVTGQYVTLPNVDMDRNARGFLGFDPIENKFKVLAEGHPYCSERDHHEVLTLGTGELNWRKKKNDCPGYSQSLCDGICINGVLYYLVSKMHGNVVQFDLRSETFKLVVAECFSDPKTTKLINYKGKLGGIECNYGEAGGRYTLELRLCVLEDVERHEWSTNVYTLPENKLIDDDPSSVSVAGMTATGEIVLAMDYTCKPYYVFYFNPERNTLKSVEIQGFGAELEALEYRGRVHAFVDHVEHLDVEDFKHSRVKHHCSTCQKCIEHLEGNDSKQLESSIFANQVKPRCSNCEEPEKTE